jgi:hypothetical protein
MSKGKVVVTSKALLAGAVLGHSKKLNNRAR